jgi:hypothetical protein
VFSLPRLSHVTISLKMFRYLTSIRRQHISRYFATSFHKYVYIFKDFSLPRLSHVANLEIYFATSLQSCGYILKDFSLPHFSLVATSLKIFCYLISVMCLHLQRLFATSFQSCDYIFKDFSLPHFSHVATYLKYPPLGHANLFFIIQTSS